MNNTITKTKTKKMNKEYISSWGRFHTPSNRPLNRFFRFCLKCDGKFTPIGKRQSCCLKCLDNRIVAKLLNKAEKEKNYRSKR